MYAQLHDFDRIVKHLMTDGKEEAVMMTTGEELAVLSLMLRVYVLPDLEPQAAVLVKELCDKFSNDLIRRYPFSEGYIDFLYGAAAFRRGGM